MVMLFTHSQTILATVASLKVFNGSLQRFRVLPGASLDFEPKVDTDECGTSKALAKDIASSAKEGKGKSKDGKGTSETVRDGKVSVDVNVKIGEKAEKDDDASNKSKDGGSIGLNLPRGLRNLKSATLPELPALERLRYEHLCLLKEGRDSNRH